MRSIVVLAAAGALASGAQASAAERATYELGFTTPDPSAVTGLTLHVKLENSEDPGGKAPVLQDGVYGLPAGTRIDTKAVTQCTATDEELQLLGRDACPAESRIGEGTITATTGTPADPLQGDVTVFNGDGQIIELVTAPGSNVVAGFDRLTVEGSSLHAHPPATPGGPPEGRTTIKEIRVKIAPSRIFTTPPSCPADGLWRASGLVTFASGTRLTVPAAFGCSAPATPVAQASPPRAHKRAPHRRRKGGHAKKHGAHRGARRSKRAP